MTWLVVEQMGHRVGVMYLGQIVEIGTAADVLHSPQRPFAKRLLEAVPLADPTQRNCNRKVDTTEIANPIWMLDNSPLAPSLVEVAAGHFVQPAH